MAELEIRYNSNGKYTLVINGKVIGDKYTKASKAAEKAAKYLKGQNL